MLLSISKNIKIKLSTIIIALLVLISNMMVAQDKISVENYNRAVSFMYKNYNNKTVFNLKTKANWFPDSTGLWYIDHSSESKKYIKILFPDLQQSELFDHEKLSQLLSDSLDNKVETKNMPISNIEYKSHNELIITVENKTYILNTTNYKLSNPTKKDKTNKNEEPSPNKKWIAYSKDYNLYIKSTDTENVKQLSYSGKKGYEYASWYAWDDIIEGENGDRPPHFGVNWSKDNKWIFTNICDLRSARKMFLLDWSVDTLYRPKLLSYYRGSPGDTSMIYMTPVFFNVETGNEIHVNLPRSTHINTTDIIHYDSPATVYIRSTSRGYQNMAIHRLNLNSEELQTIYTETSETNIDNFTYKFAEESNQIFFLSEKSGWRQLYAINLEDNTEKSISNGDYYINSIERIDEENQKIYFLASAKEKGRNPYYQHLYSISFNGENLKLLTKENLNHSISISPDANYFVDNYSTVNTETQTVLRSSQKGKILKEMTEADVTSLKGWSPPEIFTATARDGMTTIYGALWKPTDFDPTLKYPVIELSYTGPHTHVFPIEFSRALSLQSYAELGFVVVLIDGLGSSGRSKEFHNYSYKNLGGNLEDHIIAIKHLGNKYSWIDTNRVGIFGHSAGGYDAGHAVLAYPDFYKVAVASSADHDHRMEKAWWPEMYMGWPVDSSYHLQSNITMAGNLKGKLLITHGGIDENVNPSATFKLAEALIKADKQFDMLILPSQRHGYQDDHLKYFTKIRWNYFVRHLRGVEPIWDIKWE